LTEAAYQHNECQVDLANQLLIASEESIFRQGLNRVLDGDTYIGLSLLKPFLTVTSALPSSFPQTIGVIAFLVQFIEKEIDALRHFSSPRQCCFVGTSGGLVEHNFFPYRTSSNLTMASLSQTRTTTNRPQVVFQAINYRDIGMDNIIYWTALLRCIEQTLSVRSMFSNIPNQMSK
jgi:hypothetical protein